MVTKIDKMYIRILYLCAFLIFFSCKIKIEHEVNNLIYNDDYDKAEKDYLKHYFYKEKVDMTSINLRDFVTELKADTTDEDELDLLITVGQTSSNWIKNKEEIDFLISKIKSKEKAKCVNRLISSFIPNSKTMTLGNQVISIIESYRNKSPYPDEVCICKIYDQNKVDEILIWWKTITIANKSYN